VVSDIPNSKRIFSVRIDGITVGMIAAELLKWFVVEGQVAILTGNKDAEIHNEYMQGFMAQNEGTKLKVVAINENQDDKDIAYISTDKLIKEYPDLKGIYISSANAANVCRKIVELGLTDKIKIVASDIFPELVNYMKQEVIHATVFQDPYNQGYLAFKYLYEYISEGKKFEENILIKPQIVLNSNLKLFI
jgi:LacI family transcriptional regulator